MEFVEMECVSVEDAVGDGEEAGGGDGDERIFFFFLFFFSCFLNYYLYI
jgi:hypothetical protein